MDVGQYRPGNMAFNLGHAIEDSERNPKEFYEKACQAFQNFMANASPDDNHKYCLFKRIILPLLRRYYLGAVFYDAWRPPLPRSPPIVVDVCDNLTLFFRDAQLTDYILLELRDRVRIWTGHNYIWVNVFKAKKRSTDMFVCILTIKGFHISEDEQTMERVHSWRLVHISGVIPLLDLFMDYSLGEEYTFFVYEYLRNAENFTSIYSFFERVTYGSYTPAIEGMCRNYPDDCPRRHLKCARKFPNLILEETMWGLILQIYGLLHGVIESGMDCRPLAIPELIFFKKSRMCVTFGGLLEILFPSHDDEFDAKLKRNMRNISRLLMILVTGGRYDNIDTDVAAAQEYAAKYYSQDLLKIVFFYFDHQENSSSIYVYFHIDRILQIKTSVVMNWPGLRVDKTFHNKYRTTYWLLIRLHSIVKAPNINWSNKLRIRILRRFYYTIHAKVPELRTSCLDSCSIALNLLTWLDERHKSEFVLQADKGQPNIVLSYATIRTYLDEAQQELERKYLSLSRSLCLP